MCHHPCFITKMFKGLKQKRKGFGDLCTFFFQRFVKLLPVDIMFLPIPLFHQNHQTANWNFVRLGVVYGISKYYFPAI